MDESQEMRPPEQSLSRMQRFKERAGKFLKREKPEASQPSPPPPSNEPEIRKRDQADLAKVREMIAAVGDREKTINEQIDTTERVIEYPDTGKVIDDLTVVIGSEHFRPEQSEHAEATDALIEKNYSPHTEQDQAGFTRTIYTYEGKTFAFRGREELPQYDALKQAKTRLVGDRPRYVKETDYLLYEAEVEEAALSHPDQEHILATKTPLGIIEAAIALGGDQPKLQELRDKLQRKEYDDQVLALLDSMVAANFIDHENKTFLSNQYRHADALLLSALIGDSNAQQILSEKLHILKEIGIPQHEAPPVPDDVEALRPEELICVHATSYRPAADGKGGYLVQTTYDAGGDHPSNSVHVANNTRVLSEFLGDWEGSEFYVLAPFTDMMQANGKPDNLGTVDTWWLRNPGEQLLFPNATLVEATDEPIQGLFEINEDNTHVRFKKSNFTLKDIVTLESTMKDPVDLRLRLSRLLALHDFVPSVTPEMRSLWKKDGNREYHVGKTITDLFGEERGDGTISLPGIEKIMAMSSEEGITLREALTRLLTSVDLTADMVEGADPEQAISAYVDSLLPRMEDIMKGEISSRALNQVMRNRGFTPKPQGQWGWGGDVNYELPKKTEKLGNSLGVPVRRHDLTEEYEIPRKFVEALDDAGGYKKDTFQWQKYTPTVDALIPAVSEKTRRVVMDAGMLVTRD